MAGFDLLARIQADTGEAGRDVGSYVMFHNCPICGHHDDLVYYPNAQGGHDANTYFCYHNNDGGDAISYLMDCGATYPEALQTVAPNYFAKQAANFKVSSGQMNAGSSNAVGANSDKQPNLRPKKHFRKLDKEGRPTGPVLHDVVGDELIATRHACTIEGAPAIWDGKRYATGWTEIDRATLTLVKNCKINDQREIKRYIALQAPAVKPSPANFIAFKNTILDIDGGAIEPSVDFVITNVIPHDYNPFAYDAMVDAFLDSISCSDAKIRADLEEVIGVCMFRSNEFGQCPVLLGSGSNGKSTFIDALRNVLGQENVSSLDIATMGKRFQAARIVGKLANLGDDISNERLGGDVLSIFKKIVTGDIVYSDVKNEDGFEFRPYCTLVFSCNQFPKLGDSTEGMLRRLFPIPFKGHYTPDDDDFDPALRDKLTTESAAQYLIRLGIEGLHRVVTNKRFTPNSEASGIVHQIKADNDSVLSWIDDKCLDDKYFLYEIITNRYLEYKEWCIESGLHSCGQPNFTRRVNVVFGLQSQPRWLDLATGREEKRLFVPDEPDEKQKTTEETTTTTTTTLGV